jgi:hypothetical protein
MARQDEMLALVERWRSSGKSRIAFAREAGIPISTLQRWIRRTEQPEQQQILTTTDAGVGASPAFVDIAHEEPVAHQQTGAMRRPQASRERAPRLRLELGDGVILTVY